MLVWAVTAQGRVRFTFTFTFIKITSHLDNEYFNHGHKFAISIVLSHTIIDGTDNSSIRNCVSTSINCSGASF